MPGGTYAFTELLKPRIYCETHSPGQGGLVPSPSSGERVRPTDYAPRLLLVPRDPSSPRCGYSGEQNV